MFIYQTVSLWGSRRCQRRWIKVSGKQRENTSCVCVHVGVCVAVSLVLVLFEEECQFKSAAEAYHQQHTMLCILPSSFSLAWQNKSISPASHRRETLAPCDSRVATVSTTTTITHNSWWQQCSNVVLWDHYYYYRLCVETYIAASWHFKRGKKKEKKKRLVALSIYKKFLNQKMYCTVKIKALVM